MCWNKEISLNTFIFSTGATIFLYYCNTFTKYKSTIYFDGNIYRYIFLLSFIIMQLYEYFLWKSIENKNKNMNYIFSVLGFITVYFQPIFSMLLLQPNMYFLIPIYIILFFISIILKYILKPIKFETKVGEHKHLAWIWNENKGYWTIIPFIWLGFISYKKDKFILPIIGVILFLYTYIKYGFSNEWGSIWCWTINLFCLYLLFDVLVIGPYKKNEC